MAYFIFSLLCTLGLLRQVHGYPTFREKIPNGLNVPSPCNATEIWKGVGHLARGGGGVRNPFGALFAEQGFTWTKTLCMTDSDNDNRTNGEELGDPSCTWTEGSTPERTTGISHPGFCEPVDNPECMRINNLKCFDTDFHCDALNEDDMIPINVRLNTSPVPAQETTYMCQVLDFEELGLPLDKDYHLVANTPYIDNINVMHHALVYGCSDDAKIMPSHLSPSKCFMNRIRGCEELIAIWAIGANGICYHDDVGFRMGKTGYKKAMLELHWNNPMLTNTYTDGSGITLYMTPSLRPYDAGMFMIGQTKLEIPPGLMRHTENSTCSSECTKQSMTGNINIVGGLNHMHYLGSAATSQMVSDDGEVTYISHEESYTYDSPIFVTFDEPLVMKPGYKLQLACHFRSTSRSDTTYFGESTSQEMCFAFIMYYPKANWIAEDCTSHGQYDSCGTPTLGPDDCDFEALGNTTYPATANRNARLYGNCEPGYCKEGCLEVVRDIFEEPCFKGDNLKTIKASLKTEDIGTKLVVMDYFYRLDSCNTELAREQCVDWRKPEINGAVSANMASSAFVVIFAVFISYM